MTTLIILFVIASKNRCGVDAGSGCNTLMETLGTGTVNIGDLVGC